ncbi:MAG: PQQ-dependent sugar dehydrogenase [Proteobacteria bacterium]|nr:PQQ-dependent sugar dehydrogenase [Pseudomonadota bacterium]
MEENMPTLSQRIGLCSASALAILIAATLPAATQAPPGFSPLDKSNPAASKQDGSLRPHATPPLPAALDKLPVDKLKLPPGFKAEVWSHGHAGGRTIVMGPKGTAFIGSRIIGRVYAVTEKAGKREAKVLLQGLTQPNGLAVKDGALYVLAINKVLRYDNIEDRLDNIGTPVDLTDKFNLPPDIHHNWKYAAFGPDAKLYIQVGANCNICEVNPGVHGQIRRYNPDGSGMEIVARGVRNTVGFDWHPVTKELWFTDNGRDWAGDAGPEDELNRIPKDKEGANFGFPYCHANGIPDLDIKRPDPCAGVVMPAALTGPHTAGLGIKFYTGGMFPAQYQNVAFIARRGSWNRGQKTGYDVIIARPQPDGTAKLEPFMTGLLDTGKNEFYGRPTYLLPLADGSMLVSDEQNGAIYRISYAAR